MVRYRSTHEISYASHQDRILDTVVDFGYLAPRILAREEELERMFRGCALHAELAAATPGVTWRSFPDAVRRRLGEILILLGTRLQGLETGNDPNASTPAWSAAIIEAR
jgi:hypothetical protein